MNYQTNIIIGTLGPSGTSSENSAKYYATQLLPSAIPVKIQLYDTFELVLEKLLNNSISLAIVPHAFEKINYFYINPYVKFLQNYQYQTPIYGLYKNKEQQLPTEKCMIASHPAPLILIEYLMKEKLPFLTYQVKLVDSTSVAAAMVKNNVVNLALTNEDAAVKNNLELVSIYGKINMGWSVFEKKGK